ncbi:MAG: hypothetical protein ABSA39_17915 [Edaphobacter sp.]
MFGSVVLDVAIGMVFVFLLLSLIASVVQEMLATFMQLRPANLLRGLNSLFSGDSIWGKDLVDALYNHGLVRGLFADPTLDLKHTPAADAVNTGAAAVQGQTAGTAATATRKLSFPEKLNAQREWLREKIGIVPERRVAGVANQLLLPAYIPSRTFALAMIDILNKNKTTGKDMMKSITQTLAEHHWIYKDNKAGQALYTLALDAKEDVVAFQTNLENWYNDSMDRASGWYKRYTQHILFFIGLTLGLIFNVSSVRVAQTLWFDRDARQAMANAADVYVKGHPDLAKGTASSSGTASSESDLEKKLKQSTDAFDSVTSSALLPVGWKHTTGYYWNSIRYNLHNYSSSSAWWTYVGDRVAHALAVLLGWVITACAISLGAPFWFDMLNKIMVVRSTIKPQEKSQPEAGKG